MGRTSFLARGAAVLLLGLAPLAAQDDVHWLTTQPPAYLSGGRLMVPFRALLEWMGATVGYSDGIITAVSGERGVELKVGSAIANVDGRAVRLDVPPLVRNGVTFVPLRFVSEGLGAQVRWLPAQLTALITHQGRTAGVRAGSASGGQAAAISAVLRRRFEPDVGPIEVRNVDVQGDWAMAVMVPRSGQTDPASVLLRRRGTWQVLVYGTSLAGEGRRHGVPARLRARWGL